MRRNEFNKLDRYLLACNKRYGEAKSAEEFAFKSQAANYEAIRAMYQAFAANLPESTGIVQWMLNAAWPKLYWQLYDYYLCPGGAFFGVKKGAAPVSLVYNYGDRGVYLINQADRPQADLQAAICVYDLDSRKILDKNLSTPCPTYGAKKLLDLAELSPGSPVYFLDLRLLDAAGKPVADNFYWLSLKPDVLDEAKSTWFYTPNKSFADFTALDRLGQATVRAEAAFAQAPDGTDAEVVLTNTGDRLAFFIEIRLVGAESQQTLLPVFWSDNYVSLPPGGKRLTGAHSRIGRPPAARTAPPRLERKIRDRPSEQPAMKRSYPLVLLVFLIFFVISLLTNILGPLVPDIIESFKLSLGLAGFLPFSFFIAYGVMSIPAGTVIERFGEKPILIFSFILAFAGSFCFAAFPGFAVALCSLFLIGIGMAMLQVAINPLLRAAGGEEHFAFNSVLAQLVFGLASFLSPHIYAYLVQNLKPGHSTANVIIAALSRLVPAELPWISLYWLFTALSSLMIAVLCLARLPRIELKDDERVGALMTYCQLFRSKTVILYFIGIFAYVGTEQGVANWISKFLETYHGCDPKIEGANAVSYFWGLMTAGCLLGLLLLKLFDSRRVLVVFTIAAMLALSAALFGPGRVALYAFPLVGFCLSVMWSIIFSLALNSVEKHHGSFSGILCTGIIGGAVVPLLIGLLGDRFGLRGDDLPLPHAGLCPWHRPMGQTAYK